MSNEWNKHRRIHRARIKAEWHRDTAKHDEYIKLTDEYASSKKKNREREKARKRTRWMTERAWSTKLKMKKGSYVLSHDELPYVWQYSIRIQAPSPCTTLIVLCCAVLGAKGRAHSFVMLCEYVSCLTNKYNAIYIYLCIYCTVDCDSFAATLCKFSIEMWYDPIRYDTTHIKWLIRLYAVCMERTQRSCGEKSNSARCPNLMA